ncbi:MAG: ComEC/Rec2 family competence protein [Minisyncoccia bacterium]
MKFLIAITSGFASGIFLRSVFAFGWELALFAILLAILFALGVVWNQRTVYTICAIFCVCLALGMLRASLAEKPPPQTFANQLRHRVSYEGVVIADPDVRDANQRVKVRVSQDTETVDMLAVASRNPSVMVGDRIRVSGTLALPQPFDDNGRIFHYDKYLERDGVRFILNFAYLNVIEPAPRYSISAFLARIKHLFLNGLTATLPEPYSSLAGGVVIGGKTGLGSDLQSDFVRSGLIQIIVLSGYNVMIIAEWVMAALALTTISKRWGAVAGVCAILIFVGIAGASATAIRAMLMACIALYARATGRTYMAGRALIFVVGLMLVWNPLYLVYDPGFGLSVAATAGLIWLAPIIESLLSTWVPKLFRRVCQVQRHPAAHSCAAGLSETLSEKVLAPTSNFWINAIATTLAAQIAVLPLLLYDTGNLSLVAIPANLITSPIVPLAMGLSALAGFAGILFETIAPIIGIILASPAYLANAYLILIARESAALPFAAFTLPPFPFWLVLVAYATLIAIASSKRFSITPQLMLAKNAST